MEIIAITGIVSLMGAVVAAVLAHRLLGPGSAPKATSLNAQLGALHAQTVRLQAQLEERDAMEEARWRMLEESQEEVRKLRSAYVGLRSDLEKRLNDADESRRRRERELERRQDRGLERHRERELEQSGFHARKPVRLVRAR